ncbi:MAG: type 4a pilus biogenesis protein PilO [Phycisphaerales bacterium]|nr:MAG: type 4a pilus biogenesis protein PilO [Phycisphaerales bacterium]
MLFREKQQIMICIMAGVTVCVFVLFWYLPLRKRMKDIDQARSAQALAMARNAADSERLPLLQEQLLDLQSELGDYEAHIPEQRNVGPFLRGIADLMNEYNLKEQMVTPGPEVEADKFYCIPVSMQCKGSLTQLFKFYRRLQALDRWVRIEQVRLSNDGHYGGEVSMETKAAIYYRAKVGQG